MQLKMTFLFSSEHIVLFLKDHEEEYKEPEIVTLLEKHLIDD